MDDDEYPFEKLVRLVRQAIILFSAGVFWGMLAAIVLKRLFGFHENALLLFVVLPIALLVVLLTWNRIPSL